VGAIAVLAGLSLGVGLAFFRELMDRGFRTSRQVHAMIGADCVAMVPQFAASASTSLARIAPSQAETIQRHIWCDASAVRAIVDSPFAPFAEAIRSIKLAANLDQGSKATKVVGLISSVPGEGKSTVALALAGLMAQSSSRVVLVDCDLRNPSLSRSLAPKAKSGLLDIVLGNEPLEQAIWTDARTGMAFIPSLVGSHLPHTSEMLASTATKNVFDQLRSHFDYVIVDLSPLAAGVDGRLSAAFIDAYVLVVKWGKTTTDLVQHALFDAPEVRENLLGVVLNQVDFRQVGSYESYRASYYYGRERHS
jgi:succinoglycan biosynthesis transport protein ExoP